MGKLIIDYAEGDEPEPIDYATLDPDLVTVLAIGGDDDAMAQLMKDFEATNPDPLNGDKELKSLGKFTTRDWAEWDLEHPYVPVGEREPLAQSKSTRDWETWDLEHPYIPKDEASSGGSWSPVMKEADANAWAKDSAIQTTFYHGTTADAAAGIQGSGFSTDTGGREIFGHGIYLTDDKSTAEGFKDKNGNDGTVLSIKVNVQNPATPDETKDIVSTVKAMPGSNALSDRDYAVAIQNEAKSRGFDALQTPHDTLVVFDPKKITVVK